MEKGRSGNIPGGSCPRKGGNAMGMENVAILSYLEDDGRFADLFNQFFF